MRIPNGETTNEFKLRVKEIFDEIVSSGDGDSTILVIGHGGSLYHILKSTLNIMPQEREWFVNCAINEIIRSQKDNKWKLEER